MAILCQMPLLGANSRFHSPTAFPALVHEGMTGLAKLPKVDQVVEICG